MNTILIIAAFAAIAAVLYFCISDVIKRADARYERRSAEVRRKNLG